MYVYKIINSLNKKSYIGITNNIKTRFSYHKNKYNKANKREYIEKIQLNIYHYKEPLTKLHEHYIMFIRGKQGRIHYK